MAKMLRRAAVAGIVSAAAIAAASGAAVAPAMHPPEGEKPSASERALDWLERNTGLAKREIVRRASDTEESLRRTLAEAVERAAAGGALGLRVLEARGEGGLQWREVDAANRALPARLVLLVHGMDEPGGIWEDLAPALAAAGLRVARLDYANDQPLARSAEDLAAALAELRDRGVREVDIVAHSAGGLISRDVLTRAAPGMYAGRASGHEALPDVGRLIMFGTPNAGAALARLRAVAEAREQVVRWLDSADRDPAALLGFLHDGGGEVAADLRPGSAYLSELNARPLPEGAGITLVVGAIVEEKSRALAETLSLPIVRRALTDEQIREAEAAIIDLGQSLGDGLVPVSSQLLDGVEDVVYVRANHRNMLRRMALPGVPEAMRLERDPPPAIAIVLERLAPKNEAGDRGDEQPVDSPAPPR